MVTYRLSLCVRCWVRSIDHGLSTHTIEADLTLSLIYVRKVLFFSSVCIYVFLNNSDTCSRLISWDFCSWEQALSYTFVFLCVVGFLLWGCKQMFLAKQSLYGSYYYTYLTDEEFNLFLFFKIAVLFIYYLAIPLGLRDLSSPTSGRTMTLGIERSKS